jgi:hypothetical protein
MYKKTKKTKKNKNTKRTQKTQKKLLGWVFFFKCFFQPCIQVIDPRLMCVEASFDAHPRKESQVSAHKLRALGFYYLPAVLRIRDVYPGSDFFPSRIPDLNFSIPDPHQRIYVF